MPEAQQVGAGKYHRAERRQSGLTDRFSKLESLTEHDSCYYMRQPDEEREMFTLYGNDAYDRARRYYGMQAEFDKPPVIPKLVRLSLAEVKELKGESGSFLGNPWFKGALGMEEGGTTQKERDARNDGYPLLLSDRLHGKADLDFSDLFAVDPKAVEKGIGLVPEEFDDFGFTVSGKQEPK